LFNHLANFIKNHLPKKGRTGAIIYVVLSLFQTVLDLFAFSLLIPVIIFMMDGNILEINNKYFTFLNDYLTNYVNNLPSLFGIFFLIFLIKYFLSLLINAFQIKYSYNLTAMTRTSLLKKFIKLDYMSVLEMNSNIITNGLILNVERAIEIFFINFLILIRSSIYILIFIIFLLIVNFQVTITISIFCSLILIVYYLLIRNRIANFGLRKYNYNSLFVKNIQDIYSGFHIIKLFNLEEKIFKLFRMKSLNYARTSTLYKIIITFPRISKEIILFTLLISLFFLLNFLEYSDEEIINYITIFSVMGLRLFPQLILMFNTFSNIKNSEFNMETLNKELSIFNNKKELLFKDYSINSSLEFKNISFSFKGENKNIFENLNFKISSDEIIGIEGENGVGKSTFLKIVSGLIKPSSGEVIIDGKKIVNWRNCTWKNSIAYVEQNVFLFNDTVLKNIILDDETNYNKKKLNQIIEGINLKHFIEKNQEGLQKIIAENNSNISGGEKQKIAIARGLYQNYKFILFDESLSNIDENSIQIIKDYLKSIKNIGIIIISHKKEILSICDKIFTLENKSFKVKN